MEFANKKKHSNKGYDKVTKEEIACKIQIKIKDRTFDREIKLLKHLKTCKYTPNILYETTVNELKVFIMPRYEWDLATLFHGNKNVFELSTVLKLGIEIIQAIQSIHEFGITHRDLKPSNIMFQMDEQEECHIKLIDFGLSKQFQTTDGTHVPFLTGNHFFGERELFFVFVLFCLF